MRYSIAIVVAFCMLFAVSTASAQVHVGVNFNIGTQPVWGPTGYDYVQYYYMPDIEVYYDVPHHRYYYFDHGRWIGRATLPRRYRDRDLYHTYKVVINEREPWRHHETYRAKYAMYKDHHDQPVIRDSREAKYFVNKDHPQHDNWVREQRRAGEHRDDQPKNDDRRQRGDEHR